MRLRALVLVAAALTACGRPVAVKVEQKVPSMHTSFSAIATADAAVLRQRYGLALFAAAVSRVQPETVTRLPAQVTASPSPDPAPAAASSTDWSCVAMRETGADYSMHGSSYSSAFGVMNQAVRENSPPDVAERILAGTASESEQLAMAQSIEARFGIDAWAPSTAAACS